MTGKEIRTVSLTPIKSEVDDYVNYLRLEGHRVISVKWPRNGQGEGFDVRVTFEVKK